VKGLKLKETLVRQKFQHVVISLDYNLNLLKHAFSKTPIQIRRGSVLFCQFHSILFGQFHIKFINSKCI